MIKLHIDKIRRNEIEKLFLEDAKQSKTGLFQVLNDANVKNILKSRYKKIYKKLYTKGNVKYDEVEKLLLADKTTLEGYIEEFGDFSGRKKDSDELLTDVFKYENYSKRRIVSEILRKMNVSVCPYCNRQYIFTLAKGKVRPQLDHYFPKSVYPYLALSLYNMVPSCSICNMAKSALDTTKTPILYPYDEEMGSDISFEIRRKKDSNYVRIIQGLSNEFSIELNADNAAKETLALNQMEKLHLNELYNEHKDYVRDIIRSKHVNTPERIRELLKMFPMLFNSDDDVKNLMYMKSVQKDNWGNRPLSKLTHDIDKQLESGDIPEEKNEFL
jgi:hypothetical protein